MRRALPTRTGGLGDQLVSGLGSTHQPEGSPGNEGGQGSGPVSGLQLGPYLNSDDLGTPPVKGAGSSPAPGCIRNSASVIRCSLSSARSMASQGGGGRGAGLWRKWLEPCGKLPPWKWSLQCHPSTSLLLFKSLDTHTPLKGFLHLGGHDLLKQRRGLVRTRPESPKVPARSHGGGPAGTAGRREINMNPISSSEV